jgi:hypothetical protein
MIARTKVESVIGKGFADKLDETIIDAGSKLYYTRRQMVEELGCANFVAAAKLNKVLKRLKVETPSQLHNTDPFSLARTKGIGEACIFVVMCILDANKYDVIKWWRWNEEDRTKFSSFKSHAIAHARRRKHEV